MSKLPEEATGFLVGWFLGSLFVFLGVNYLFAFALHAILPVLPVWFLFTLSLIGSTLFSVLRRP